MARRLVLVALAIAAALAAALGALFIWRVPVAQSAFDWAVKEFEIPGARATVERIAADRVRFADLAAGDRSELAIDSVEIEFQTPDIAKGEIDGVAIAGLTLNLDLRDGAALLGSLQPLMDSIQDGGPKDSGPKDSGGRPLANLPDLRFRESRLEAQTPYGPASIAFDGVLIGGKGGDPVLRLQGELSSALARLTAELSASGDPQKDAEARLAISDGAVELPDGLLHIRAIEGDLNLSFEAGRPRSGRGALTANGLAVAGTPFDKAQADFDLSRERAELTAGLSSDDGSFDLALQGRAEALGAAPQLWLELRAEIGDAAPIWALSRPPFPVGGDGQIELTAVGEFPALPQPQDGRAGLGAWLAEGGVSGTAAGTFSRLALPGTEAEATALVDLAAVWTNRELSLATRQENRVTATGLSAKDLAGFGLPEDLADEVIGLTGGNLSVTIPTPSEKPSVLVWRPGAPARGAWFDGSLLATAGPLAATLIGEVEAALGPAPALTRVNLRDVAISAIGLAMDGYTINDLEVTGSFAGTPLSFEAAGSVLGRFAVSGLTGLSADQVSLSVPFQVSRDAQTVDILLAQPGRLTVKGLDVPDRLRAEGPVDIALAGGKVRLVLDEEKGTFALSHETRVGLGETRLLVQSGGGDPIPLRVRAPGIALAGELGEDGIYGGTAAIREAALILPDFDLAFEELSADLELPGGLTHAAADFEIAALRHLASPAAFAPLQISGQVSGRTQRSGETIELTAQVNGTDGQELADVAATHDLAAGSGHAEVTLQPLEFMPGGLQPAALSPRLAELSEARGTVAGSAALSWGRDGLAGEAQIVIADLAFTSEDLEVSGLDLNLELDSLQPPASPPHQILRADIIDPGVPIKGLEARFRLPPDAPGQILIEDASFSTVGGRFAIRDTLLDPAGERIEAQLQVDRMDIAVLFDLLAVEGLSGSGELTGTIPIQRDGDLVTIADARLAALAPGVLRFRSDAAKRALEGGGEYVDLVIQALEDFRYETLMLTGNLNRDGETRLRLEILGSNPNVLEGHPFQLNINLTGNSTQILEAILLSRTLIREIMERARRLSQ
jgi:hypothetical protein